MIPNNEYMWSLSVCYPRWVESVPLDASAMLVAYGGLATVSRVPFGLLLPTGSASLELVSSTSRGSGSLSVRKGHKVRSNGCMDSELIATVLYYSLVSFKYLRADAMAAARSGGSLSTSFPCSPVKIRILLSIGARGRL